MGNARRRKLEAVKKENLLKLDLGCGPNKREGFEGVDVHPFKGVDHVLDLVEWDPTVLSDGSKIVKPAGFRSWPWEDGSVGEVWCSHFLEHLEPKERIHFVNELYRVMAIDAVAHFWVPHWNSGRAYGDLTHKWPPVSEMWLFYLCRKWREDNAPHNDFYKCNFMAAGGHVLRQDLLAKNPEYQAYALANYKEAAQDLEFHLTKVPMEKDF